eukprot:COSAG02_NODE_1192_length_13974_cov_16.770378_5_plen_322_part_00
MVACEICDNWFHLRCVGLREDDTLPKNFMCRDCVAEGFIGSASEDWIMEATEHGLEPDEPKRQRRIMKTAAHPESSKTKLPKGDLVVRGKVREKLTEALSGSGDAVQSKGVEEAGARVEEALLRSYGGTGPEYKKKARDLAFNFADSLNVSLRMSVVQGAIAAEQVVRMSNTELANEQTRIQAAAIEREKVRQSQKHHAKLDQSTMDRDGTVHWVEAEAGDDTDGDSVPDTILTSTAVQAAPAVGDAGGATALAAGAVGAGANEKSLSGTPTEPLETAKLRSQEQRLLDQIAALPPDVVAKLPAAQRKQFDEIVQQQQQQQ